MSGTRLSRPRSSAAPQGRDTKLNASKVRPPVLCYPLVSTVSSQLSGVSSVSVTAATAGNAAVRQQRSRVNGKSSVSHPTPSFYGPGLQLSTESNTKPIPASADFSLSPREIDPRSWLHSSPTKGQDIEELATMNDVETKSLTEDLVPCAQTASFKLATDVRNSDSTSPTLRTNGTLSASRVMGKKTSGDAVLELQNVLRQETRRSADLQKKLDQLEQQYSQLLAEGASERKVCGDERRVMLLKAQNMQLERQVCIYI